MSLERKYLWPTPGQELLLQAALAANSNSIAAWEEWKSKHVWGDHLDNGSFRLMPLVYQNLRAKQSNDSLLTRLKGIYRFAWCQNQKKFHSANHVLRVLHDAGIQTMILKGVALSLLHYKDNGVRPMADIDVLVQPKDVPLAVELLRQSGWSSSDKLSQEAFRFRHSLQLKNQSGEEVDLHWHLLYECCQDAADTDFWEKPVPIKIHNVSTLALNPTDTLLHVIIHGLRWNPVPTVRWVADAVIIINCSDIDWPRLIHQAQKRRLGMRLKAGLSYLHDKFPDCVPEMGFNEVKKIRISFVERIEYRYVMKSQEKNLLGTLPLFLIQYARFSSDTRFYRAILGLPNYLQFCFRVSGMRGLLVLLLRKSLRRTIKFIPSRSTVERPARGSFDSP